MSTPDARAAYQRVNDAILKARDRQAGIVATVLARVASGLPVETFHPQMFRELQDELDMLERCRNVARAAIQAPTAAHDADAPRPHTAEVVIEAATRAAGRVRP